MTYDPLILFLFLLSGLAAGIYWLVFSRADSHSLTRSWTKTVPLLVLCGAGLVHLFGGPPGYWVFPAGLGLGAMGDWFLSRPGKGAFLAGMAAFAAGHLAYVAGFWPLTAPATGGDIAASAVLFALVLSTEVWLTPRTGALKWPVRGYVVIIGAMGVCAILLAPTAGSSLALAGAGLFVLSDLLLALRLFVWPDGRPGQVLAVALWPVYWAGQALILLASIQLWPVVTG